MNKLTFNELVKNSKKNMDDMPTIRVAILGDCATQHLATAIRGYGYEVGFNIVVFDADYNQIDAQILDSKSELYEFKPQIILIYMCAEKLYEDFCKLLSKEKPFFSEKTYEKIKIYWSFINQYLSKVNIIQFTFTETDDRVFGNYALKTESSFLYQVKKLNLFLADACRKTKNVHLIDLNTVQNSFGRNLFFDDRLYYTAKMPISLIALPYVAKTVLDTAFALNGHFNKCIILDLDNTLWGGVIGDDGLEGIQIGELGIGRAFTQFQMWLKELKNRGIILAVCSKNDEEIAKKPFLKHPDMVLRMEDISVFISNWENKVTNILKIQKTLNIGMDSIVFLDDNPFERNLVRNMIPEITVPELPSDPAEYLPFLEEENLFEISSFSENDTERTEQYRMEIKRIQLKQQFSSFDDYLADLEMIAEAKPFDAFHYPRIAQLTQRSNQFNLRTVRYTETEIENIANDMAHLTIYFNLKDKFGDYGLISAVILDKQNKQTLFISEWLMSCRVLKRGMEEFIVNKIIETAKENGYKKVIGEYIPTPKNMMVKDLYKKLGFIEVGENVFEAETDSFLYKKTFIRKSENDEQTRDL